MPHISTIADYMLFIARLNLCTPSEILISMHKVDKDTIIKQAHQVLYKHGNTKERRLAHAYLATQETKIS